MIISDVTVYKSFIKCNDIGRNLGDNSKYIYINGMLMFHPFGRKHEDYSEYDNCIQCAFFHDKIVNSLNELIYVPMYIDGAELYTMNKEYGKGFKEIEILSDKVIIRYKVDVTEDSSAIELKFWAMIKTDSPEYQVTDQSLSIDLDLIQRYQKFVKDYKPQISSVEYEHSIPILNEKNDIILTKMEEFKDSILGYEPSEVIEKEITEGMMESIKTASYPMHLTFNFSNCAYKIRLMKSMFKTHKKNDIVNIKVFPLDIDKLFQNIIVIRQKEFTICSSYKTISY